MRQIIFDTETTGLNPKEGHRIIEVGAIEIINRRKTGRTFHRYFKPDREVDAGALEVHGITNEFLSSQPRFGEAVNELLEFLSGAELVIHNASFDVSFMDAELERLKHKARMSDVCQIYDTLALARKMHPGQRNSLDALCKRYEVDNSNREYHGALLDAELLLDVYLAMTGGQDSLVLDETHVGLSGTGSDGWVRPQGQLPVLMVTAEELAAHEKILEKLDKESGGKTVWRKLSC